MLRAYPSHTSVLGFQSLPYITGRLSMVIDLVEEVLRILFKLLSLIEYDYSIMDSTKITDWLRGFISYSLT